jgi:hypothetical protein
MADLSDGATKAKAAEISPAWRRDLKLAHKASKRALTDDGSLARMAILAV